MCYSIYLKAERRTRFPKIAKIYFVFHKKGYVRVKKVLSISGPYEAWNSKTEKFRGCSSEINRINRRLQKEKNKYKDLADRWEERGKLWTPKELSHYFEKEPKAGNQLITVSAMLIKLEQKFENSKRFKNGRVLSSHSNAVCYKYLRESLENFTRTKYRQDFSKFMFRDITRDFIEDYVFFELKRGAKNNNSGGIHFKIRQLKACFGYAKREKVFSVDMTIFDAVKEKLKPKYFLPRTTSHDIITAIKNIDRSILNPSREFYLDLFLFSYYAGGMSNIDICFLTKKSIENENWIVYERIKTDKYVRVMLLDQARLLIAKYQKKNKDSYIFPIIRPEDVTEEQQYKRVDQTTIKVNKCLVWICKKLDIKERITWSTARKCFISKLIDEGYHPYQVAEQVGNCPQTIYRYYYSNSNKEEMLEHLNEVL